MNKDFSESWCGYYPERRARIHSIDDSKHELNQTQVTRLLQKGYRRYAGHYYKNYCRTCHECIPYRVLVDEFKPNRAMRRTFQRNADLTLQWYTPLPTEEKFQLYLKYQLARHKSNEEYSRSLRKILLQAMIEQMYTNPIDSIELTIYKEEKVIGFAIFDVLEDSLSAVYSVFDPDYHVRSLGTFNILQSIEKTCALGLPYLNLGLYLEFHEKMNYKSKFTPAEIYINHAWRRL
ncbi:MAG TPA: arginyltransferase [Turneriella sp.]|nr:arginyltransferase [Turneriella sp.]